MKAVKAKRVLTFAAFILVSSTHIGQWLCLGRPNLAMLSVPVYSCIPCVLAHNAAWRLNACKTSFHGLPFKPKKRCSVPSSNESIIAAGIRSRKVPKCTMCKRSSNLFFSQTWVPASMVMGRLGLTLSVCDAMELEVSSHPNSVLEPFCQKLLDKNRSTGCTSSSVGLSSNGERRHEPPCRPSRNRMPQWQSQWETQTIKKKCIVHGVCVCTCRACAPYM